MIPRFHVRALIALALLSLGLSAGFYSYLPDPCPIHWNIRGEVDGYGPRWVGAFFGPMIFLPVIGLLLVMPALGPFRRNFEDFRVTYGRIAVALGVMLTGLQLVILLASIGLPLRLGGVLCAFIGIFVALIGNWMGKLRRNFYVGIRTPWTLANEVVWERTHRIGGKLMVAAGLISATAPLFLNDVGCFVVLISTLVGTAAWALIYSYRVYRKLGAVDDLAAPR